MAQTGFTPILIYSSSTGGNAPNVSNLTNSTLGSELAINIADGKLFYKDSGNNVQVIAWKVTPTTAGGTGLTSYTAGDLVYYATGTTFTKLAIGSSGRYLASSGTAPQWNSPAALTKTDDTNVTLTLGGSASTALLNAASLTLGWTGQLSAARGGTGIGSYAVGDILYADTTTSLAKLADVATGNALISGGVGVAPSWGKIGLTTHVSGTLAVGNGGTGATTFTANRILLGNGGSAINTSANLTWDGSTFIANGSNYYLGSTAGTGAGEVMYLTGSASTQVARFYNFASSAPSGLFIYYPSTTPNNTVSPFLACSDVTADRCIIRSNGGIANYSGNDVNLSDQREKTNIQLAGSYLNKICAIPVKTFNYVDQNQKDDPGLTLGVIAQDVQPIAPELVMESDWAKEGESPKMRLSIYQTDLQYALMKSLQELKQQFDDYVATHP